MLRTGATFSRCRAYRYSLWRIWNAARRPLCFVMLNPSTADEIQNDPTVERCEQRARRMGFGGLLVANIFALRSTDPAALYGHADPVGPRNDIAILRAAERAELVVCAWGRHGNLGGRGHAVLHRLNSVCNPHVLRMNADGTPAHPLYLSYACAPRPLHAE